MGITLFSALLILKLKFYHPLFEHFFEMQTFAKSFFFWELKSFQSHLFFKLFYFFENFYLNLLEFLIFQNFQTSQKFLIFIQLKHWIWMILAGFSLHLIWLQTGFFFQFIQLLPQASFFKSQKLKLFKEIFLVQLQLFKIF